MIRKYVLTVAFLFLGLWFIASSKPAYAVACTSNGSGNWSTPGIWLGCNGGYPGQTNNDDTVTIATGHSITLDITPANPINRLTVQSGSNFYAGTNSLTISGSSGTPGLYVAGGFFGDTGTVIFNNSVGALAQTLSVTGVGAIEFNHTIINNVTLASTGTRSINVLGNFTLNNGTFTQTSNRQFLMRGLTPQTFAMTGSSVATLGRFRIALGSAVTLPPLGNPQPTAADVDNAGTLEQTAPTVNGFTRILNIRNSTNTADTYLGVDLTPTAPLGSTIVRIEGQESLSCTSGGDASEPYAGRCFFITPTNTGVQTVVTLWALTLKEEVTFPLPAVYRYSSTLFIWEELTNRASGSAGLYTYATGTTSNFSPFLMANSGDTPTAINLQNMNVMVSNGLVFLGVVLLLTILTGLSLWRARRTFA